MRILAVDVGNTSTAVGLWIDGKVASVSHIDGGLISSEKKTKKIVSSIVASGVDGAGFASVVPSCDKAWRAFLSHELSLKLAIVSAKSKSLVTFDYPDPGTIGADRAADASGAVDRYGSPVIVADFGTATTLSVILPGNRWIGGVIAPGFPLMSDYLFEKTAKLPRMKMSGRCPKIGKSTAGAMRFGAIAGYRGMVREITAELQKNFNYPFKLVATGGYAGWVLRSSGLDYKIDPDLTLHGVGVIAKMELQSGKTQGRMKHGR